MHQRLCLFFVILTLTGCGTRRVPQAPVAEEPAPPPRAEVRIGDDPDEPPHLAFKITAVHEKQKPSADAPFYVTGGDWTVFDCQAGSDPKVTFTIGVASKSSAGKVPIAWGNAVLIVKDREAGGRFVELFGKSFSGKLPAPVKQAHVPGPLAIKTAILGHDLTRGSKGGFSGKAGGWTATKWFPEHDGRSGEVFFNYNLARRQGEFSEKDGDYADDLVAVFASALRDGPRPERTPENDPNLTRIGPAIAPPRKLLPRLAHHYAFSPGARFAIYQDDATILALPIDKPDGKPFEIARFDHAPWEMRVVDEDLTLLVQEGIPEMAGVKSSGDPMRVWWVDCNSKQKKLLRGPEKGLNLAEAPVSPDHRYVALDQWRDNPGGKGRIKLVHVIDRETGKATAFSLPGKNLSVVGWKKTAAGMRAVAVTNRWRFVDKETSELYLADPAGGKLERQENVDPRSEIDNVLSPDGKYRVRAGKGELVVTDVADGKQRRFIFNEDDRRFAEDDCIEWASPRYLKFNGPRLALIDVTTMKMCYPAAADGVKLGGRAYKFSSDFRWVLYQGDANGGEGCFLAAVEMPKEQ